jgi:hypothetical protein
VAPMRAELVVQVAHMGLDGVHRQVELVGDLGRGELSGCCGCSGLRQRWPRGLGSAHRRWLLAVRRFNLPGPLPVPGLTAGGEQYRGGRLVAACPAGPTDGST